jgi:2-polyprenyl-3-methyl-5-hydroxy-6-metoxy-1,4-benzoquinol methylase
MNNTDSMWEKWGESNPYHAVLTTGDFHGEKLSQTKDAFFETGRAHIGRVMRDIEQRFGAGPRHSVLDFGCGVGRLLLPLSSQFDRVEGMD